MNATKIGLVSAFVASLCCVAPVGLAVLGLGGLGIVAFIGANHWYFIAGAGGLIGLSWYAYLQERQRCKTERCEFVGGKVARVTLPLATLAVLGFFGLNLYAYAGVGGQGAGLLPLNHSLVTIPTEGMTCYSCAAHVEHSLTSVNGVEAATASVSAKTVTITYDPGLIGIEQLVNAINKTGYKARNPTGNQG